MNDEFIMRMMAAKTDTEKTEILAEYRQAQEAEKRRSAIRAAAEKFNAEHYGKKVEP